MSAPWMEYWNLAVVHRAVIEAVLAIALLVAVAFSTAVESSGGTQARRQDTRRQSGTEARDTPAAIAAEPPVTIAGVAIAPGDEVKHFKLIGTTGTGKSTAIRELLGAALDRGDRAVITDPDGGYLARYHDVGRGDVILNPFDSRSVKWDPFAEVRESYDAEQLAQQPDSLIRGRLRSGMARLCANLPGRRGTALSRGRTAATPQSSGD